jgi:hypothetical protein
MELISPPVMWMTGAANDNTSLKSKVKLAPYGRPAPERKNAPPIEAVLFSRTAAQMRRRIADPPPATTPQNFVRR